MVEIAASARFVAASVINLIWGFVVVSAPEIERIPVGKLTPIPTLPLTWSSVKTVPAASSVNVRLPVDALRSMSQ